MDWCWLDWPQLKQPLSERSKKYILDLDIEADAQMLRERLHICQEAVDYFRASSRLLQAGVKAGLSLYEIAIMCCRNDNQGEIPSKLEILTSMATELATSAVENGRWHHAAASRALAEQLSPNGGSLLLPDRSNALKMRKSASSAYFASFFNEHEVLLDQPLPRNDVPGMASSVSDSSSDVDDMAVDCEEDCEEWAAALIADVSLDKSMSIMQSKMRSPSVESDGGSDTELSSSPKGFWHVRPCTSPSVASDDESIQWSPHIAPKKMADAPFLPLDIGPRVTFADKLVDVKPYGMRMPVVSFADFAAMDDLHPASLPDLDKNDTHEPSRDKPYSSSLERTEAGFGRSRSYTALSSIATEDNRISQTGRKPLLPMRTHDYDQFRDYFLKFVDLVIVRETTAATLVAASSSS